MLTLSGTLALRGRVRLITRSAADGRLLADSGWLPNTICNPAANAIAAWLTGTGNIGYQPVPFPSYAELGTGSGTTAPTDTALFQPVASTNVKAQILGPNATTPSTAQWIFVWGPQYGPLNATEIGLFDGNGLMFAHIAGLTIDLATTTSTSLQWAWDVTLN